MEHPALTCVAEVVTNKDGIRLRGSGYRVADGWVLTAAHVVTGADDVKVWLPPSSRLIPEHQVGVEDLGRIRVIPDLDLALLPVSSTRPQNEFEPPLFGQLDRGSMQAILGTAWGFPWYKIRSSGPSGVDVREDSIPEGRMRGAENIKTGTIAFHLTDPSPNARPAEHPAESPWGGMSGAAVFASGHLIGVVGQVHPLEPATLTVRPLVLPVSDERFGVRSAATEWQSLLPQLAEPLPVVTPPSTPTLANRAADEVAKSLAPHSLAGRAEEWADLEDFSRGRYRWRWIQGDAYAGKTALLATYALERHDGVNVVACFLTGRHRGSNTEEYALRVLSEQLAAVARLDTPVPAASLRELELTFRELLEAAARASRQLGLRLLALVDGLDEYDPHDDPLEDWLPTELPNDVDLLVSSRSGATVRLDQTHPLYSHIVHINPSAAATDLRRVAHQQLRAALALDGDSIRHNIVGYLAATSGGLTCHDLAELLESRNMPVLVAQVRTVISDDLSRVIELTPDPNALVDEVAVFAHLTLQDEARTHFADDLPDLRSSLYSWVDVYQGQRWPPNTPAFCFFGYRRLLMSQLSPPLLTEPEAMERMLALLKDRNYEKALRLRSGWLLEYVRDVEFMATLYPDRILDICYRALRDSFPNSYLRQRLLHLVVHTLPARAATRQRSRGLQHVVNILRQDTVDIATLAEEYERYSPGTNAPAAAALVLGMGLVGGVEAASRLLTIFSSPRTDDQIAWAAADGLIAAGSAGDRACQRCKRADAPKQADIAKARELVVRTLIDGYPSSATAADRRRRLYVLAFLRAKQARTLAEDASQSNDSKTVGWGIKLLSMIGAFDADTWLPCLHGIAAGEATGPWRDEWTQKRLIRALGASRLSPDQSMRAYTEVLQLTASFAQFPTTKRRADERRALVLAANELRRSLATTAQLVAGPSDRFDVTAEQLGSANESNVPTVV